MPSQQEVKWSQLKIGIIVIVSTALLVILLFLMTSSSGMSFFSKKIFVTTYFDNAGGIQNGAPVELEGVTIGDVQRVEIVHDAAHKKTPVKLILKLDPRYRASLHTDSTVGLATVGVLGDTVVNISSENAVGPELKSGDELQPIKGASLQDVIKSSKNGVDTLNQILAKIDHLVDTINAGQGTAGKLLKDPAMYDDANATLHQLRILSTNLNEGRGSAGKLLTDDQLYNRLNDTVAKLDDLATRMDGGKGSAGKLLTDDKLYDNLNQTLARTNSLLANAQSGKGSVGILLNDPTFARKLTDTVDHLDTMLNNVNAGKGTLGKLATDDAAYTNLNQLMTSSNDLVTAIRKDPKKYLSIKLKVF